MPAVQKETCRYLSGAFDTEWEPVGPHLVLSDIGSDQNLSRQDTLGHNADDAARLARHGEM
jgi:hypothetical protein